MKLGKTVAFALACLDVIYWKGLQGCCFKLHWAGLPDWCAGDSEGSVLLLGTLDGSSEDAHDTLVFCLWKVNSELVIMFKSAGIKGLTG